MAKETGSIKPVGVSTDYHNCDCCNPPQNLFPRPDLAGVVEGTQIAIVALCIFHKPAPTVYVWSLVDNKYEKNESLRLENQQVLNADGSRAFSASLSGPPSILELDDETDKDKRRRDRLTSDQSVNNSGGSQPSTTEQVNLEDDGFWSEKI